MTEAVNRVGVVTSVEPPTGFRNILSRPKTNVEITESKSELPPVMELVPDQGATAEALKSKLEHALHDVCDALDAIEASGLHGSFNLNKGHVWQIQQMIVAKHL